jgi:putative ABC transport system substrate-binding protein
VSRREFIVLLGAGLACPHIASTQQPSSLRRIGVMTAPSTNDPLARGQVKSLQEGLEIFSLRAGHEIDLLHRGGAADPRQAAATAKDLVAHAPEVIVVASTPAVAALLRETATIPIVFVNVADPVGSGFVKSIDRPGGTVTGFTNFELSMAGKWLQIVKEISPTTQRILALYDPGTRPSADYIRVAQTALQTTGLELQSVPVKIAEDIEAAISAFARVQHGALMVLPDVVTVGNRRLIVRLAAEYRLPAVYGFSFFAVEGGLVSYGPNSNDLFRRAGDYVARVLRGERPGDLPVQGPTKFELVINIAAAKALGLVVPPTLLAIADEVID